MFTQVLLGLFLGLVTFSVCFVIQLKSPDQPDYKQEQRAVLFFSPYLFFVNALAEEFFFRGFIQSLLFQLSFSPVVAITLSSTIFALYHIPMFRWSKEKTFIAFLGGLLFGTTFFFTQSLIIVWFAHGFGDLGLVHEAIGGYFIWTKIRKNRSELYRK